MHPESDGVLCGDYEKSGLANPVAEARTIIGDMVKSDNWKLIDRDIHTFLAAIDLVSQYNVHIWDATIAA